MISTRWWPTIERNAQHWWKYEKSHEQSDKQEESCMWVMCKWYKIRNTIENMRRSFCTCSIASLGANALERNLNSFQPNTWATKEAANSDKNSSSDVKNLTNSSGNNRKLPHSFGAVCEYRRLQRSQASSRAWTNALLLLLFLLLLLICFLILHFCSFALASHRSDI